MTPSFHDSWNTDKEIEFLAGLGSHTQRPRHRLELLEKYFESFSSRKVFCINMDAEKIRNAVLLMISCAHNGDGSSEMIHAEV